MKTEEYQEIVTKLLTEIETLKIQVSELETKVASQPEGISRQEVAAMILKAKAEIIISGLEQKAPFQGKEGNKILKDHQMTFLDHQYEAIVSGRIRRLGYQENI
jgi:predicted DNA-binding protein (UPF0251 family)